MSRLGFLLLLVGPQICLATLEQFFDDIASSFNFQCDCFFNEIAIGNCTNICDAKGCFAVVSALGSCAAPCAIPSLGTGCFELSYLTPDTAAGACPSFPSYLFPTNGTICTPFQADVNYLLNAYNLDLNIRAQCAGLNAKIASGGCAGICLATTCVSYFSQLQICAKQMKNFNCYVALNTMRQYVSTGLLDCQNFNKISGACMTQQSDSGIANTTITVFEEAFPEQFGLIVGPTAVSQCECLKSNISACDICSTNNTCDALIILSSCANNTAACASTGCRASLAELLQFVTYQSCFEEDSGFVNCTNATEANSIRIFECGPIGQSCPTRVQAMQKNTTVPIFKPVYTPTPTSGGASTPTPTTPGSAGTLNLPILSIFLAVGLLTGLRMD